MPSEERTERTERSARSAERCAVHPTRSSVSRCSNCRRPLCLTCAVPVRGRVLGPECLAEELGADAPPEPSPRAAVPGGRLRAIAGWALVVALAATLLPWSRFGVGSGVFGAWGRQVRWAHLATLASGAGILVWLVRRMLGDGDRRGFDVAIAVLGALTFAGALLAISRPPPFTHTAVGPWVAGIAGAVACAAALMSLRSTRNPSGRVP